MTVAMFLRTNKVLILSILSLLAAATLIAFNLTEIGFYPNAPAKLALSICSVGLILMSIAFAVAGFYTDPLFPHVG